MTKETAEFLLTLLGGLTLNVGALDFDEVLPRVIAARAELQAVITGA